MSDWLLIMSEKEWRLVSFYRTIKKVVVNNSIRVPKGFEHQDFKPYAAWRAKEIEDEMKRVEALKPMESHRLQLN